MQEKYWTSFIALSMFMIVSFLVIILVFVLTAKGILSKKYLVFVAVLMLLIIVISVYSLIPYIKDYDLVSKGNFLEDDGIVVEFTYIRNDPDGNGQTQYSNPKFYIESKDKYIILHVRNVEKGKKYRIRYLPNSQICEVLYCIEE